MEVHIMDKKRAQQITKQIGYMLVDSLKVAFEETHNEMVEELWQLLMYTITPHNMIFKKLLLWQRTS